MMWTWLIAIALGLGSLLPVQAPVQEPVTAGAAGRNLEWPKGPGESARYRVGNIQLTFRNRAGAEDSEMLDRILTVEVPGLPAHTIDSGEDDQFAPSVMVVPTPARTPAILFQTFSGGAHCCVTITALVPHGGRITRVVVYEGDGGPLEEAPTDLDGDGVVDFVRYDNAFLYTFSSYAGSFAPPTVVNIVGGEAVDVTTKPAFRSLFQEAAREARKRCADPDGFDRNGACAGYVASAARLGRFDEAWAEVVRDHDRTSEWFPPAGCRASAGDAGCPEDQVNSHPDFPTALRAFLQEQGYIPAD